jgi:HEAT repeat protein
MDQDSMTGDLTREVRRFKTWAESGAPDVLGIGHGRGEWECNYPHWEELYESAEALLAQPHLIDEESADLLLYVLARDNEDERIADELKHAPLALSKILQRGLTYPDPDARWQIAMILAAAMGEAARETLHQLSTDTDEYVRRRATFALDELG